MTEATLTTHRAALQWEGGKDDLRAHRVQAGGQTIAGSCSPEWGGDPSKADPEALFVAALSACHMLWFLDLARRKRIRVASYEDEAEGTMDGTRFTAVVLRPRLEWADGHPGHDVVQQLHGRAHELCFIANSVSCSVEVQPQ